MRLTFLLLVLLAACGDNIVAGPVPDAQCDLVSCEAGASFECCPPLAPPKPPVVRTRVVSPLGAPASWGWTPDFGGIGASSRGCMLSTSGGGRLAVPLLLDEGDRLTGLVFALRGDTSGSVDVSAESLSAAPDGSLTLGSVGNLFVPNAIALWRDHAIDLVDTTVTGGTSHWFEFTADQPGACVGALRVTFERSE